jgi:hypothetical protein
MSGCHPPPASIAIVALTLSLSAAPAGAEGFFEFLFGKLGGGGSQTSAPAVVPPSASRPLALTVRPREIGLGRGIAFCVRMCDGRYFPMQRSANVQPGQVCNSLCPATKTKVFAGPDISRATAADGSNYSAIENAFLYRQETVENCTCNGVTAYGLATMDARNDPTLRAGDLIATPAGLIRSAALSTVAFRNRDEEIVTSSLPLGMRGPLKDTDYLQLRGSSAQETSKEEAPKAVKSATRRSFIQRTHDLFAQRKRTRQAR